MCGIIGYTGKKMNAKDIVLAGLKNLEYRGYDSSGIAVNENGKINLYKSHGKISNLEDRLKGKEILSSTAIAHTRWATHGKPNETNAHPHRCGKVTLVHNGIIENYMELKKELLEKGVTFQSETDTEVACAYINDIYESEKDKIKCLSKACSAFRGSYAFAIIFDDEKDVIYATRKDSPLIVGLSDDGNFAASDVSAILDFTAKYILLEYGEFAKITKDKVTIYNADLKEIEKEVKVATWSATEYKKNGYDHFMLKEINEQPDVIANIFSRYLNDCNYNDIDFLKYDAIHIVACGSAMHAGMVGKYLFQNYANIPVTVDIASEYRYSTQMITPSTLVIIISQSGETADSLAALRLAHSKGATTLGIVNAVGSTIARESDICIYTYAGPEIAVATTKGYTSQVAILSTLVINAMKQKGLLSDELFENIKQDFSNISSNLNHIISKKEDYINVAQKIFDHNDLFFIGRGIDSAVCMEGSLKLKEISYMHSESYAAGELKHGTISLIEKGTPVIAIATNNDLYEKTISNIKETKARGAFAIFITTDNFKNSTFEDFSDISITLPKTTEFVQAIEVSVLLQLIAYETAKLRNCDIDKPKNLAKSVTVE
ncbi:MAG: glutamine--fructose-6-phosphate transaminase (isomerizing) [Clostridia bacterium]|nr:glutamine--fructose-6-phosphate transaminase (isomerizing) [Clostridia bacterium]